MKGDDPIEEITAPGGADADRAGACVNCGATGAGRYCSQCGRVRVTTVPTFPRLVREALEQLDGIESRLRRTLVALVLKPGHLTREHVEGRGSLFVPPMKLLVLTAGGWGSTGCWSGCRPRGRRQPTWTVTAARSPGGRSARTA